MPRVWYPTHPVADPNTLLPLAGVRNVAGTIVVAGTNTPVTLTDSNGLPVPNPISVTNLGVMPGFWVEEGFTHVQWVSGPWRLDIRSADGLEMAAIAAQVAAEAAADRADAAAMSASDAVGLAEQALGVIPDGGLIGQVLTVTAEMPDRQLGWTAQTGGGGGEGPGVASVNNRTGAVSLTKADVGLSNVDDTPDTAKPVSGPQQTALAGKANVQHTHAQTDIVGLAADLASKRGVNDPIPGDLISTGTVAPARLGSGAPDNTKVLFGDGTWRVPAGGGAITMDSVTDATTVGRAVVRAADQAAARGAIGAGTSSLQIGTTSTTAKRGDYAPAISDVQGTSATTRAFLAAANQAEARTAIGAAAVGDYAALPPGVVVRVEKSGGVWPNRPTSRTDLKVWWYGDAPAPAVATAPAVNGAYVGDPIDLVEA